MLKIEEELFKDKKGRTGALVTWILELVDIVKDWIYLLMFKHKPRAFLILAFSLSIPFAFFDQYWASTHTFIRNLLNFIGIMVEP